MDEDKQEYFDLDRLSKIQSVCKEFTKGEMSESMFKYRMFLLKLTKEEWGKLKDILHVSFDIEFRDEM